MDPIANLKQQIELARKMRSDIEQNGYVDINCAERLAELVLELDEWRTNGGFDPYIK